MRELWARYKGAIAFVFLAIVLIVVVNVTANHTAQQASRSAAVTVWKAQVRACEKYGNTLRQELNHSFIRAIQANKYVLTTFLNDAATARHSSYVHDHLASDLYAAQRYLGLVQYDNQHIHIVPLTPIDCHAAYPHP